MKVLISTFGDGDLERTLLAMRRLPYDRLVLLGEAKDDEPVGVAELRQLESMAGHDVLFERVGASDFMGLVDDISDIVSRLKAPGGGAKEVIMNISGGTKLMADAALFAAFRLGVPAYHVSDKVVRLPVMKGVTAKNRFTPAQARFMDALDRPRTLTEMEHELPAQSRQSLERTMRDLRKMELVSARLESGRVTISLTDGGREVRRVLTASNGTTGD